MELRMPNDVVEQEQTTTEQREEVKDTRPYWEKTWENLVPGVVFKINKLAPLDRLAIVYNRQSITKSGYTSQNVKEFVQNWIWTRNGGTNWNPVVNQAGTANLPELDTNQSLLFDLANIFQEEVIFPVFIESKAFRK